MKRSQICGISVVNETKTSFAKGLVELVRSGERGILAFSLNGESLCDYHRKISFRRIFDQADFVHADGMSIVRASVFISDEKLPERIATTDWFHDIARITNNNTLSHFFLGGKPDVVERAVFNVKRLYPELKIAGWHHGYYDDLDLVLQEIQKCKPDIVWLGLGRPKQEYVALSLKQLGEVGLIKTCGGLFDFLSGKSKRAPEWMQRAGLEWMYRLYLEPKRLFRRYFITNIYSMYLFTSFFLKKHS